MVQKQFINKKNSFSEPEEILIQKPPLLKNPKLQESKSRKIPITPKELKRTRKEIPIAGRLTN